jgi:hypothetical protein
MAKYDPLRIWLATAPHPATISFDDLGRLVGGLPRSASKHRPWWGNDRAHVAAVAWLDTVEAVDLRERWVRFT